MTCVNCGDGIEVDGAIDFILPLIQAWDDGHKKACPPKTHDGVASASRANGGGGVRASTDQTSDAPTPSWATSIRPMPDPYGREHIGSCRCDECHVIAVEIDPEAFTYFGRP